MTLPDHISQGRGDTAVFLLHGVGGAKEAWLVTMAALADVGMRAVAWDMPGYGTSATLSPYTLHGLALALESLIDHVGARRNVLLGHSMGGMVAQEAVALYPAKVHGLLLCATSPAFGRADGDWQRKFLQARFAPLDAGLGMAGLAAQLVPAMVGPDASAATVEAARSMMAGVPEASYRAALAAIAGFDRLAQLPHIAVPTLCVAGEHDRNAAPAVVHQMAQRIPDAGYLCLPGAGHLVNLERPREFNAAALSFVQHHFPTREP